VLPTYSARHIPRIKARTIVRHHGDTPPARGLVALAQFAACPNRKAARVRVCIRARQKSNKPNKFTSPMLLYLRRLRKLRYDSQSGRWTGQMSESDFLERPSSFSSVSAATVLFCLKHFTERRATQLALT
jgi:hypothetical protein